MKRPFVQNCIRVLCACYLMGSLSAYAETNADTNTNLKTHSETLSLEQAVALAREQDPWLQGNLHAQRSMEEMSVASSTLPDPKVSVAFANLPTDSWEFDQEPMTQFKVGISQMFPRGDQLQLKQKQLQLRSAMKPYERQEREAQIQLQVSRLWLEVWRAQASVGLIERNRYLFEQMTEITQSSYSSALGRTRQQDVIRAQLELTRLEDRLSQLQQQRDTGLATLAQWVGNVQAVDGNALSAIRPRFNLPDQLVEIELKVPPQVMDQQQDWQQLAPYFMNHPSVRLLEQQIIATDTEVDLAKQKYQPEWGLNASYGYREDDPVGNDRADFFSVGVSFDLPLFTGNRQDREVAAAVAKVESVKTQKWLRLKTLLGEFESTRARWERLSERHRLYRNTLLPQMHEQAEAALTAYTNDNGDFAEVMRARIAELNAEIDALAIAVQRQQAAAQLNYYFVSVSEPAQGESIHE